MKVAWQFTARELDRTVPSRRGLSDFAAKRLYRTAQGLNPGFGVARIRPESGGRGVSLGSSRVIPTAPPPIGCHFQGTFHRPTDPGLKPWAVLCSRFAAKSDSPRGNRAPFTHIPDSKLPGYLHSVPTGQQLP